MEKERADVVPLYTIVMNEEIIKRKRDMMVDG